MEVSNQIDTKQQTKKEKDLIESYEPGHTDESSADDDEEESSDEDANIEFPRDNA